jgi:hypothetical protein
METEFLPICTWWRAELVLDAIDDIADLLHPDMCNNGV